MTKLTQNRYLICVHAGDTLSPSLMSSFDQGAHMVDLFNEGLDIFVPGNHEFDFGKEVYFERMKEASYAEALKRIDAKVEGRIVLR
jgi:5'-nucleotidase / UDP-sugar diphosphatase